MVRSLITILTTLTLLFGMAEPGLAQRGGIEPGPDRREGEGAGPFERLIIRGATLIDGTGAPPVGPVDIVVEYGRIRSIQSVGYPGAPIREARRPEGATHEIDAHGMYVLPGFVDTHGHIGGAAQGTPAEYVYKLWLAHGVTTVRDPGSGNGVDWTLRERERSARNEIVAPRIFVYVRPGMGWDQGAIDSPMKARQYVQWAAEKGVDGFKLSSHPPEIMEALIDEAHQHGLGTQAHLAQTGVAQMNALDAARLGLGSLEHWYGLPEALFDDRVVQDYPADYNYNNEYDRFREAGRLWRQAAPKGSRHREWVIEELLALDLTLSPTLTIYEATRDLVRAKNADWHERYTLPSLKAFFQPNREAHGSFWFDWTTRDEIEWKENFHLWMEFLNEYKNRGGRVCTGSDSGYIYKVYGFDYIRELELLQEAGFHPLEVITAATKCGATTLVEPKGREPEFGVLRPGMIADMVIVEENPLQNFKVLYGTGHLRVDMQNQIERVGGVKYTIKEGIVYDAKELLNDVARIVAAAKRGEGVTE